MKRIFMLLIVFCALFSLTVPLTAFAAEVETPLGCSDSEVPADVSEEEPSPECVGDSNFAAVATFNHKPNCGSVTVIKVDAAETPQRGLERKSPTPSPLAGTVFGLYSKQGHKLAELTIGGDGTTTYGQLPKGDYFLKELAAAEGFILSEALYPFSIGTRERNVEIVIPNERGFGTVKVLKTGENGVPLSGVTFDIYRTATDEKTGELVTSEGGFAEAELSLGRYYLVETATVEGYLLTEDRVSFALTEHGSTVELPIQNQKKPEPLPQSGRIRLITKSEDGKLLPGAVFGIYRADTGEKVGELATGSDGVAVSTTLPILEQGYYLLEQTAPAGYIISSEKTAVSVKEGEIAEIIVINKAVEKPTNPDPEPKPGKLLIIKKAEKFGTLLKGAVFGVYRESDGKLMKEIATDRYGEATMELAVGDYYLRELEAPAGFRLDSGRLAFRIKSCETKEITIVNKAETATTGSLLLIKKSGDGKALSGAVFGIYDASTREKLDEITTDRYGEATLTLEAGSYYLRELKAPSGYAISADKIDFKIKAGEIKEIAVTNKVLEPEKPSTPTTPVNGTLKLVKRAAGSGQPLSGAIFEVFSLSDNKRVGEITSGSDGTAELTLHAGEYYLLEKTAPTGYKLETARILFRVKAGSNVKVEVTNMKDDGGQSIQPVKPNPPTGAPGISIPKTGEDFPTLSYTLAGLLFALAGVCGFTLWWERRKERRMA